MSAELNKSGRTAPLGATLNRAITVVGSSVGEESSLVTRLRASCDRLQHERLHLAVLGQFKRGKSTFINALLGAPILPTGVIPVTAVATFIAWGPEPLVSVNFRDGRPPERFATRDPSGIRDFVFRFVSERGQS